MKRLRDWFVPEVWAYVCLTSTCAFVLMACDAPSAENASPDPVLARVGQVELTSQDLERAMAREPGAGAQRYQTKESRRQLLDGLVRFEVMAQAAEAAGWMRDPEVVHAWKQLAVQKFIQDRIGEATSAESIQPAEVEAYYQANKAKQFSSPPAAQVQQVVTKSSLEAHRVLALARQLPIGSPEAFAKLAERHSIDGVSKRDGGHLGFVSVGSPHPREVIHAALALATPGDLSAPIETSQGWVILRLVGKRAPAVQTLKDVETHIRQALQRQHRQAELDRLVSAAQKTTKVTLINAE